MGRVFPWRDIAENRVPLAVTHERAVKRLAEALAACEGIEAGLIFGSAARSPQEKKAEPLSGAFPITRSDIDLLVVYEPGKNYPVREGVSRAIREAKQDNLLVDLVMVDTETAYWGAHTIKLPLLGHLELCARRQGNIIKRNPLDAMRWITPDNPFSVVIDYLEHKLEGLFKGEAALESMDEDDLLRFLQKALESALHVARRMLWYAGWRSGEDDGPAVIVDAYSDAFGGDLMQLLRGLVRYDRYYTERLAEQLQMPVSSSYDDTINVLKCAVPDACRFVRENLLWLLGREGKRPQARELL